MAYVTKDNRVIAIVQNMHNGYVTKEEAKSQIEDLGFLKWESIEAVTNITRKK